MQCNVLVLHTSTPSQSAVKMASSATVFGQKAHQPTKVPEFSSFGERVQIEQIGQVLLQSILCLSDHLDVARVALLLLVLAEPSIRRVSRAHF